MAGTGKSTISSTVASNLLFRGSLGASFFFKRGDGDRSNPSHFFTTIAAHLVVQRPSTAESMRHAIDAVRDITDLPMDEQFEKLIFGPLKEIHQRPPKHPTTPTIVVVDALDECEDAEAAKFIILCMSNASRLEGAGIAFFVTSRPEHHIRLGFLADDVKDHYERLILQQVPQSEVANDIQTFLVHRFQEIRESFNKMRPAEASRLSDAWPGEDVTKTLVKMAVPLFIYAATVCRFIENPRRGGGSPNDRLAKVIGQQFTTSNIDAAYLTVLNQMLEDSDDSNADDGIVKEFKEIVGPIILLAEPLSIVSIAKLLGIQRSMVENLLDLLHAVLDVPDKHESPVRLLHKSFHDFLICSGRAKMFSVNETAMHSLLAHRCLDILNEELRENICQIGCPGEHPRIEQQDMNRFLSPSAQYACRYWAHHLSNSALTIDDNSPERRFLQTHFLHWLEALGLLGRAWEIIDLIITLKSTVDRVAYLTRTRVYPAMLTG